MLSGDRDGNPPSTEVQARGCAVVDLILHRKWPGTVEGRIFRSNGEPAPPGIEVTLLQLEDDGQQKLVGVASGDVRTGEHGEYSLDEVAPGRYKVVVNLWRFSSEKLPYPTIYWPNARTEDAAPEIEVKNAASAQPDNHIADDDSNQLVTCQQGTFSFTALEGFEYRLYARMDGEYLGHYPEVPFSLGKGTRFVTRTLGRPGRFDDDPAARPDDPPLPR